MATSKAMGTGRKAATSATRRIPPMVTWAMRACGGRSSTARAPRTAARSVRGKATRKTYQKLCMKELDTLRSAWVHVSETGISMGQAMEGVSCFSREATKGAKTKIRKSTVASLRSATENGKRAKVMARTTTLRAGEANIVARTD